jgi:hypothetical protein
LTGGVKVVPGVVEKLPGVFSVGGSEAAGGLVRGNWICCAAAGSAQKDSAASSRQVKLLDRSTALAPFGNEKSELERKYTHRGKYPLALAASIESRR